MTYIYDYENTKCTLEEIVKKHKKEWDSIFKKEYSFWKDFDVYLEDIIAETSDSFEEALESKGIIVKFKEDDGKDFNLNILLKSITYH
jgi:hypothetical protein